MRNNRLQGSKSMRRSAKRIDAKHFEDDDDAEPGDEECCADAKKSRREAHGTRQNPQLDLQATVASSHRRKEGHRQIRTEPSTQAQNEYSLHRKWKIRVLVFFLPNRIYLTSVATPCELDLLRVPSLDGQTPPQLTSWAFAAAAAMGEHLSSSWPLRWVPQILPYVLEFQVRWKLAVRVYNPEGLVLQGFEVRRGALLRCRVWCVLDDSSRGRGRFFEFQGIVGFSFAERHLKNGGCRRFRGARHQ